ncbi:MAG TPA: hypothetical protein DCS66_03880, partial [Flavobacteriaceae bacterium]|nr:hypothetical protein [Flavobacteriaceae bacterium]
TVVVDEASEEDLLAAREKKLASELDDAFSNQIRQIAKKGDTPEAKRELKDFIKEFKDAVPGYKGMTESEKGFTIMEAGLKV